MKLIPSPCIALLLSFPFSLPVVAQNAASVLQRGAAPTHFVCSAGYSLDECREQMNVLRKALAKYPTAQPGAWTWVLVRSGDWRHLLLERGFDANRSAFSFLPKRETFLDEALVVPVSTRGAELSALWHMTIEDLLDLAVRHELGHALCDEKDEAKANRVAKMLRDGISPSCAINLVRQPTSLESKGAVRLASQASHTGAPNVIVSGQHFVCDTSYTLKQCENDMRVLKVALAKYPASELGEWTWVLVRSADWTLMLRARHLDPGVPALTVLGARTTLFEEALVGGAPERFSELMDIWHLARENLLDLAIRHELGHALCGDRSEIKAGNLAKLLAENKHSSCEANFLNAKP